MLFSFTVILTKTIYSGHRGAPPLPAGDTHLHVGAGRVNLSAATRPNTSHVNCKHTLNDNWRGNEFNTAANTANANTANAAAVAAAVFGVNVNEFNKLHLVLNVA